MERLFSPNKISRRLEDHTLGKISIGNFLSTLAPEEFDVLWDLTDDELTIKDVAKRNGFSESQVKTIRLTLARKASVCFN